jgi:predicted nucleic acid-binding protein
MSEVEASTTLQALGALPLQVFQTWPLALLALQIACQTQQSVYDSLYLALAVQEQAVLVTADHKLYLAIQSSPLSPRICWVEDVP